MHVYYACSLSVWQFVTNSCHELAEKAPGNVLEEDFLKRKGTPVNLWLRMCNIWNKIFKT